MDIYKVGLGTHSAFPIEKCFYPFLQVPTCCSCHIMGYAYLYPPLKKSAFSKKKPGKHNFEFDAKPGKKNSKKIPNVRTHFPLSPAEFFSNDGDYDDDYLQSPDDGFGSISEGGGGKGGSSDDFVGGFVPSNSFPPGGGGGGGPLTGPGGGPTGFGKVSEKKENNKITRGPLSHVFSRRDIMCN